MNRVALLFMIGALSFFVACAAPVDQRSAQETMIGSQSIGVTHDTEVDWAQVELIDVTSGETYTIASLQDMPVLIETFAVWCPTCLRQQNEVRRLHEERQDIVSVALNIDPNEGQDLVVRHAEQHSFSWRFSVSPPPLTRSLIDAFGTRVVNAPSASIIVLCPDGSSELLRSGVKPASELAAAVDERC